MKRDFAASKPQFDFITSLARFLALLGGVGSGKTAAGAVKARTKIAQGEDGAIIAPDFPHLTRSTFVEAMKWLPMDRCTNAHLNHPFTLAHRLTFDVGGKEVTVHYGGADDPTAWTGQNLNWAWLDEMARKRDRAIFDILAARLRVGKNPQLWVTTTPAGVNHWLYDVFVKQDFPDELVENYKAMAGAPLVQYFHVTTAHNQANLDPFFLASLQASYTGKYARQELLGEFISLEGSVWEDFVAIPGPDSNVTEEAEYTPGVPVEWWIDDGYTKKHPRVIALAQEVPPYLNVFDEYVATYELSEISLDAALAKGYPKPQVAYVDSSAAELCGRLEEYDIDVVRATHDVEEGIKHTAAFIRGPDGTRHLRFHPRCTFCPKDIASYVRDEKTNKPIKDNDHASDLVRYGTRHRTIQELIDEAEYAKKKQTQNAVPEGARPLKTWYGL